MGFALSLVWDLNDSSTQWQPLATGSSLLVAPNLSGGLDSESTAEEHGSEPDLPLPEVIAADNSSMDLLASVASGIIEVSPYLISLFGHLEQFRNNQNR